MGAALKLVPNDVVDADEDDGLEPLSVIRARIDKRFNYLEAVTHGIVAGDNRSTIISGAPGVGKTFTMSKIFREAESAGTIKVHPINGAISPVILYKTLFQARDANAVVMVDDCDSIFEDSESLNVLKAALDTSRIRRVSWNKASKVLDSEGIPNNFDFEGSVAFITNVNFERQIARESKLAKHYNALMDRSLYIDLCIHNRREVFVRINQVTDIPAFQRDNNMNKAAVAAARGWIWANLDRIRNLSIRTVIKLGTAMRTQANWQEFAEETMLKPVATA